MRVLYRAFLGLAVAVFAFSLPAFSQTIRINIGSVAPVDSPWHDVLKEMAIQWKKVSGGKVEVHIYPGGVMGDEDEMLRKVNAGLLQGVGMSGVGLSRIAPGVSALQIPMLIDSYAQFDHVRAGLEPKLEATIRGKGYEVLNWSDVGWVYFFAAPKALHTPADLKPLKLFTSAGDAATEQLYRELGFTPSPLNINELLTALETGRIEAFDVPPLFALANQSFGAAQYMTDMKWAPVVGATIIDSKAWNRIPADLRPKLLSAARDAGEIQRAKIRELGDKAIGEMQRHGLKVVKLEPRELAQWRELAQTAYPKLKGGLIPKEDFDEAVRLSKDVLPAVPAPAKGPAGTPGAAKQLVSHP
jgi:TRAP-type C4-dicarboxylate transport system substrate-binding protein